MSDGSDDKAPSWRSKEYNYLAARLVEERQAATAAATPEARKAHQELAARYAQMLKTLGQQEVAPRGAANLA